MTRLLGNQKVREAIVLAMLVTAAAALLLQPQAASEAAREGLYICIDILIPSLFPLFVISTLFVETGVFKSIGRLLEPVMRPLFRVNGSCAAVIVLGFFGGYPVGAKSAISLYEKGQCSKEEAERLLAFCNNSGPAFILGATGVGILGSSRAGWLLYLSHMAASITVGLIFRYYKTKGKARVTGNQRVSEVCARQTKISLTDSFIKSVKSSFEAVFYISAFVIFFTVVVRLLFTSGVLPAAAGWLSRIFAPFGLTESLAADFLTGLIEMTSGLFSLQSDPASGLVGKMAMAAFMLGWAGLSIHCQVLSFIGRSGLSSRTYIFGKMLHAIISAIYAFLLTSPMGLYIPYAETIAEQVESLVRLQFGDTLRITLVAISVLILVLLLVATARLWRKKPSV